MNQGIIPSGECPVKRILNVDDIEPTNVLLSVHNDTSPTHVTSTGDHDDIAGIELDEVSDLALFEVVLDGIVSLDEGVGVTDGATVVGDDMRNASVTDSNTADFKKLVGGFLRGNTVNSETTLDIVEQTEVLARLLNGNDV